MNWIIAQFLSQSRYTQVNRTIQTIVSYPVQLLVKITKWMALTIYSETHL